ncbi:arylamine N-acetyltransferase [Desulfobulbus oligotrophicus]|uniref:Arylamine N-acetyltransferase n=2 Tax=Desulfobulbus oligotrophicus TaxID=1909699 RepID=A0A7T6AQG7_9BACT|nr:arylamine N-acetyltransferase [Desulfobulbus oligotrophicus]
MKWMRMEPEHLRAYLKRLDHHTFTHPDQVSLHTLQAAHLLCVPFENLSIHWAEPMRLSPEHFYRKIVTENRGGICYENNILFANLLRSLGYKIDLLSAQVAQEDRTFTPAFDHVVLLVHLEETWLVDVGFGDSFRVPLLLRTGTVQTEQGRSYRIDRQGNDYLVQQNILQKQWTSLFKFTLSPREIADFQGMFKFHRDSPASHFRKTPLATLATPDGRKTLTGSTFIYTTLCGLRTEWRVSRKVHPDVLNREFGIRRTVAQMDKNR